MNDKKNNEKIIVYAEMMGLTPTRLNELIAINKDYCLNIIKESLGRGQSADEIITYILTNCTIYDGNSEEVRPPDKAVTECLIPPDEEYGDEYSDDPIDDSSDEAYDITSTDVASTNVASTNVASTNASTNVASTNASTNVASTNVASTNASTDVASTDASTDVASTDVAPRLPANSMDEYILLSQRELCLRAAKNRLSGKLTKNKPITNTIG